MHLAFLGQRDEIVWRNPAPVRMLPADQCLGSDDRSGPGVNLRLVLEEQFIPADSCPDTFLKLMTPVSLDIERRGIDAVFIHTGPAESDACCFDKVFRRIRIFREPADANADGRIPFVGIDDDFLFGQFNQLFTNFVDRTFRDDVREQDDVFVSVQMTEVRSAGQLVQ